MTKPSPIKVGRLVATVLWAVLMLASLTWTVYVTAVATDKYGYSVWDSVAPLEPGATVIGAAVGLACWWAFLSIFYGIIMLVLWAIRQANR